MYHSTLEHLKEGKKTKWGFLYVKIQNFKERGRTMIKYKDIKLPSMAITKASLRIIKGMDREIMYGIMANHITANGRTDWRMGKEFGDLAKEIVIWDSGNKEK